MENQKIGDDPIKTHRISIAGRHFNLPQSRTFRVVIGCLLVFFGCLGFLPVLGFWMIPLGLWVLSREFSWLRRLRRKVIVWWERRKRKRSNIARIADK